MLRVVICTVFLGSLVFSPAVQQPQRTEPQYDVNKCKPTLIEKAVIRNAKAIQMRKGDKPTGFSPVITFEILESGRVVNARVKRSSGIADKDAYALKSIRGWKFNSRPGCGSVESEADVLIDLSSSGQ